MRIRKKNGVIVLPRARMDLFDFANMVLPWILEGGFVPLGEQPHREMTSFLQELVDPILGEQYRERQGGITAEEAARLGFVQTLGLMLVPRGSWKTTIGVTVLCLYLMHYFPDIRILLTSHGHAHTQGLLSQIKETIAKDEFINTFGDWRGGPGGRALHWSATKLTINRRTKAFKEPTVQTAGVDKSVTGGHYDIIIADDVHDRHNSRSSNMRRAVRDHIDDLSPLLEPAGTQLIIGTRWHHADAYGQIIKADELSALKGGKEHYKKLVRSAFDGPHGLYFGTRLTAEFLADQRAKLPNRMFAVWYLNKPIADSEKVFPDRLVQFFEADFYVDYHGMHILHYKNGRKVPLYVTMAWDPAGTKPTDRSDSHGFSVVGNDIEDRWHVLSAEAYKGGAQEVLEYAVRTIRQFKPSLISVEDTFGSGMWLFALQQHIAMHHPEMRVALVEYHDNTNKHNRIELALQPLFKQGRILLKPGLTELRRQLDEFPDLEHEDVLDSLVQHKRITRPADMRAYLAISGNEDEFDLEHQEQPPSRRNGSHIGHRAVERKVA